MSASRQHHESTHSEQTARYIAQNLTNGHDEEAIYRTLASSFARHDLASDDSNYEGFNPRKDNGQGKIHHLRGALMGDSNIGRMLNSGRPVVPSLPKGLVGGPNGVSIAEYWQIYREVTMLALMNQTPFVSLDADPATKLTEIKVDLPPLLKNTLVGHALIESDYLMKTMTHYPNSYVPEEKRAALLADWRPKPDSVRDFMEGAESINAMKTYFKKWGAILFAEDRSIAHGMQGYNALQEAEQKEAAKYPNSSIYRRLYPTQPTLVFNNRGEIACTSRYAVTSGWYYDSREGRRMHNDPDLPTAKFIEKTFRQNLFPPAQKIMKYMDLIYILYPIARGMVENGVIPNFSEAPPFNFGYSTPDRLPPILNVQNAQKETYVRVYGGVNYNDAGTETQLRVGSIDSGNASVGAGNGPVERGGVPNPVRMHEVMDYREATARKVKGDGLEAHHAVQSHVAKQVIAGYDHKTGPSIILTEKEHRQNIRHERGDFEGDSRDALAQDIRKLRVGTSAPNAALQKLIELNKSKYPSAFQKGKD